MATETLKRTPLYDRHVAAGAKLVPFAGWEMPVQYEGVIPEHMAVRKDAGAFDVSHMGEIDIEGPRARELLDSLLSNDLARIGVGQAQYTLLTNERGGIVDDLIVYQLDNCRFLLIVNASNAEVDFEWIRERELRGSDATLGRHAVLRRERSNCSRSSAASAIAASSTGMAPAFVIPSAEGATDLLLSARNSRPFASLRMTTPPHGSVRTPTMPRSDARSARSPTGSTGIATSRTQPRPRGRSVAAGSPSAQ